MADVNVSERPSAPGNLHSLVPMMPGDATPSGRALLDGSQCQTGEHVKPSDLLAVNFNVRTVSTGGGLYLVQSRLPGREWRGCRYLMRTTTGITIDQDGRGDWATVASMEDTAWEVVGKVETVYRPTHLA